MTRALGTGGISGTRHVSERATFAEQPIIATIALSSQEYDGAGVFQPWRSRRAFSWIETLSTPKTTMMGFSVAEGDPYVDQLVQLITNELTFHLDAFGVGAAAVGSIYRGEITYYDPTQGGGSIGLPGGPPLPPESGEGGGEKRGAPPPPPRSQAAPINIVDFVLVDKKGTQVGYHKEIQLEGGASIIVEEVAQRLAQRKYRGVKGPVRAQVVEKRAR